MDSEGYDLRWGDHLSDVFSLVRKLRGKRAFSDVIVHCGGQNFLAHKIILAASSIFFEKVLASLPDDKSKVLVMAETRPEILSRILDFIYNGDTYIEAENLEDFINSSDKLGIRGMRKESNSNQNAETESRAVECRKRSAIPAKIESAADENLAKRTKKSLEHSSIEVTRRRAVPVIEPVAAGIPVSSCSPLPAEVDEVDASPTAFPGPSGSQPSSTVVRRKEREAEEDVLEAKDGDNGVKRESDDFDYSNDGGEWGEPGDEGGDWTFGEGEGQYDENYVAPEGGEQPQNIPPEISKDHPMVPCNAEQDIWQGFEVASMARIYFCSHCGFSSPWVSSVKRHRLTHTGERPFACSYCERRFALNFNLTKHLQTAHYELLKRS